MKRIIAVTVLSVLAAGPLSGFTAPQARAQQLSLIRDAEIEDTIRTFATPLFRQTGVDPDAVQIHLVKDKSLNAFVAGGLNLFLHTGLIIKTEHPGQLIGVIAHESGHIAGGHLVRGMEAYDKAGMAAMASMILGAAAAVASRRGDLGAAVMMGGTDVAGRSFMAFSRTQESSADQAGVNFLDNLHQSARGFMEFMQIIGEQDLLAAERQDPYVRTHPLTRERIDFLMHHVETSPWSNVPVPAAYNEPHQRMRAKLFAFMETPMSTLIRYKESDTSLWARYARAIAWYRKPDLEQAIPAIDALIAERPKDPYFLELKGQMLFENGKVAEAVPFYQQAVALQPASPLLHEELGQVLIETENPALLNDAEAHLRQAVQKDPDNAGAWRLLATAYGRQPNKDVQADEAMAEYYLLAGDWEKALYYAGKAQRTVKNGTPLALRLDDIRTQAELGRDRAKQRR